VSKSEPSSSAVGSLVLAQRDAAIAAIEALLCQHEILVDDMLELEELPGELSSERLFYAGLANPDEFDTPERNAPMVYARTAAGDLVLALHALHPLVDL